MNISRDLGSSVFTWTDVVTGVTGTRTEYSRGTGVEVTYSAQEVAWTNGTLNLAQSSANTGTTDCISLFVSAGDGVQGNGIYATINNVVCAIAVI